MPRPGQRGQDVGSARTPTRMPSEVRKPPVTAAVRGAGGRAGTLLSPGQPDLPNVGVLLASWRGISRSSPPTSRNSLQVAKDHSRRRGFADQTRGKNYGRPSPLGTAKKAQ